MIKRILAAACIAVWIPFAWAFEDPGTIEDLAWLEGHWAGTFGGAPYEERWGSPEGGLMQMTSKMVVEGEVPFFEFGLIERRDDGVFLVPFPRGKRSSDDFRRVSGGSDEAVFENPRHDFPTRIVYRLRGESELVVILTGPQGERGKVERAELKKVPCK